jgi:glutamine---fructose-6-phosphate transaminase (isomerizing)
MISKCYQEIVTQQFAWQEAVETTIARKEQIVSLFKTKQLNTAIFIGCTSSYYGGLMVSDFWRTGCGINAAAYPSSELIFFPNHKPYSSQINPFLIALSRSGKTTETIWAMEEFENHYPGRSALIGCANLEGPLSQLASLSILLPGTNEETIPQTRSLSAMMVSGLLMGALGVNNEAATQLIKCFPNQVSPIIDKADPSVEKLMQGKVFKNIFILGGGPFYNLAQEIALKCMEMSSTDTFSYQFMESRHGPRSLIDQDTLVIGFYSRGGKKFEARVMDEYTRQLGATTLAVVPEDDWETGGVSSVITINSGLPDQLTPLLYLPVGQLVAYYCAKEKNLNPDVARNHTPYVEVERA